MERRTIRTAMDVARATAVDGKRTTYWDDGKDTAGLYLEAHPTGRKTFGVFRRFNGKLYRVTIKQNGVTAVYSPNGFGLAEARAEAVKILNQLRQGINPAAERRQAVAAGTLGELIKRFFEVHGPELRPVTRHEWERMLQHEQLSALRAKLLADIKRVDIAEAIQGVLRWSRARGHAGTTANRTLAAIKAVYSWAAGACLIEANPAVGLKNVVAENERERVYTDNELARIIRAARADGSDYAKAVLLAAYTGVRISLATGVRPENLDLVTGLWVVPAGAEGNKADCEWRHPLTEQAQAIAAQAPLSCGSSQHYNDRLREASGVADFRPHDLRRSIATWLKGTCVTCGNPVDGSVRAGHTCQGERNEVVDAVLMHVVGDRGSAIRRIYDRFDNAGPKRAALVRWAAHLDELAADAGRVLSFTQAAQPATR